MPDGESDTGFGWIVTADTLSPRRGGENGELRRAGNGLGSTEVGMQEPDSPEAEKNSLPSQGGSSPV